MSYIDDFTVTHNDDATVTITGDIPYSELAAHRKTAIEHLGKDIEVDGFRKGNVPEEMLVEKIGEMNLLSEMAERALAKTYPELLQKHAIDAVGYPQVSITKLAPENDLGFSITVAVVPDISLPDYREIAKTHTPAGDATEVTDEEIEHATKDILRRKVAYERLQAKAAKKEQAESGDLPTPETVENDEESGEPTDAELPELTDEVVKTIGNFDSVAAFTEQIRTELAEQKVQEAKNKHRAALTDALIEATEMTVPQVMIDAELEQMTAQMKEDIARAELKFEDYLQHVNKTEEDLRNEWKPAAEKRAKVQLVLDAIATEEGIEPDTAIIDEQVAALTQQYPEADPDRVRTYVRSILRNESVMKLLEGNTDAEAADPSADTENDAAAEAETAETTDSDEADATEKK